jgi:hypothetical protein
MTTLISQPHTAKIYQFPLGGRASVGPRRIDSKPNFRQSPKITPTAAGDGWYHDAAIQEASAKWTFEH